MRQTDLKMAKENKQDQTGFDPVDSELAHIIEAALFASKEPLGIRNIMALFPDDAQPSKVDIQNVIMALEQQCEFRGIELRRIGKGWRYQSKEKYSTWLRKLGAQRPPRYSRALLETLSIIAYRQPVTRSDIEEIRGVAVSSDIIRVLEEREWVQQIGYRDVPGRPSLFGTTQEFLEYFNMSSLRELPELMDRRELGEIAKDMNLTLPMDGVQGESEAEAEQQRKNQQELSSQGTSAQIIELRPDGTPLQASDESPQKATDGDLAADPTDAKRISDNQAEDQQPLEDE